MEYSTRGGGGHGFSRVETETLHTGPLGAINTAVDGATGHLPGTADHQTPSPTPGVPLPSQGARHRPAQSGVWTAYITHFPVRRGFLYLVAVMD